MSYSPFYSNQPSYNKYNTDSHKILMQNKELIVNKYNFQSLKNEIMGMSNYYFDPTTKYIWEFDNSGSNLIFIKPDYNVTRHLVHMNNLQNTNYATQSQIFQV